MGEIGETGFKIANWIREKKLYIEITPNQKILCCVYDLGEEGEAILSQLKRWLGEIEGHHINEKRNCCTVLFETADSMRLKPVNIGL